MSIDPKTLAVITSAATVACHEFLKGGAGEAGKASWEAIKSLFQWSEDPAEPEIPEKIATDLLAKPETAEELLKILANSSVGIPSMMVGNLVSNGGVVKIVGTINATTVNF